MKTVLIIEDSDQNLYLVRFILEKHGYQVVAASDGPSGIHCALQHRPTLILLDIQLPGMDGYQVAAHLRTHAELAKTPIVAVTSYAMAGDRERIMAAGCTGYLEKPIDPETFVTEIEAHLTPSPGLSAIRVLVVDDHPANLAYFEALFRSRGWGVRCAEDGTQAIEAARREPPNVILTDILMPGMDGFTLCREWRADVALTEIPFVFCTATYTDPQDRDFALSLGADEFLLKPIEPQELMSRLDEVLARKPSRGGPRPARALNDPNTLREYNAVLIRKLEDKMLQVERLNRELESRIRERTRELEEANAKLQVFGNVGTWSLALEPEPRLAWSDQTCRIFGLLPGQFDGRPESYFRLVHPQDLESLRAAHRSVGDGHGRLDLQHRIVRPDGQLRWVHQEAELVRDSDGRPLRVVGVIRETTDSRLLEERLRQSQKLEAIGQLAAGAAHDFNNTLGIISAHASLVGSTPGLPPEAAIALREVQAAVGMAAKLTRQLLTFGRRQETKLGPVRLNEIVSGMAQILRRLVSPKAQLIEELTPDLPAVLGDRSMLEQVIVNLVVNARDAVRPDGRIRLQTSLANLDDATALRLNLPSPGPYCCLTVNDTGCGIDAEGLQHLFEPFFTTKASGQGTGLGLAVVYGIVRQHRGHIGVTSVPGTGTTFTVYLPVDGAVPSQPPAPADATAPALPR